MLTLPIKRKWFDMICRGEKREEYREPTDYWKERLFRARGRAPENEIPDPFHLKIFPIQIRAGYRQDSPRGVSHGDDSIRKIRCAGMGC